MWQKVGALSLLFVFFTLFSDQDEEKFLTRSDKRSYIHIIHIHYGGQDEEKLLARSFQHNRLSSPLLSHQIHLEAEEEEQSNSFF